MKKPRICLILVLVLSFYCLLLGHGQNVHAASIEDSGNIAGMTWTVSGEENDLTLTITGEGVIPDLSWNEAGWTDYRPQITKVILDDRITDLGRYALNELNNITTLTLPRECKHVHAYALNYCYRLETLIIPPTLQYLDSPQPSMPNLKEVYYGGNTRA